MQVRSGSAVVHTHSDRDGQTQRRTDSISHDILYGCNLYPATGAGEADAPQAPELAAGLPRIRAARSQGGCGDDGAGGAARLGRGGVRRRAMMSGQHEMFLWPLLTLWL